MVTRPGVLMIVGMACSSYAAPPPPSPPPLLADLPAEPGAVLEPERPVARLPIKEGYVRLTALDIDMPLPPDASMYRISAGASLSWNGCSVQISVAGRGATVPESEHAPRVARRVGTFDIECVARPWSPNAVIPPKASDASCLAVCDRMRPVPGSTALQRYPSGPPTIELELLGGIGGTHHGVLVWNDGTTQFYGPVCPAWRGRRATLRSARVAALLHSLDGGGFFGKRQYDNTGLLCSDAIYVTITARLGAVHKLIHFDECSSEELAQFAQRLEQVIGHNPCLGY